MFLLMGDTGYVILNFNMMLMHVRHCCMYNVHMKLHQIDLNLLLLFDALYRHRSVSRAAEDVCLSQSAFSHGLARLRGRLQDELFIRIDNIMQPTLKANLIAKQLSQALPLMQQALNETSQFDPQTSTMNLTFAATDFTQFSLLPKLIAKVQVLAPKLTLSVKPATQSSTQRLLETGEVDFVLGFSHTMQHAKTMSYQTWYKGSYCTIARKNHPTLKAGLNLERFLELSHVLIAPWGEKQGIVDESLSKLGLKRQIALTMPSVMVAPFTIVDTDLLLTVPELVAEHCAKLADIDIYETPIEIADYQLDVYWHKLNSASAAQRWICGLIAEISKDC